MNCLGHLVEDVFENFDVKGWCVKCFRFCSLRKSKLMPKLRNGWISVAESHLDQNIVECYFKIRFFSRFINTKFSVLIERY